MLLYKTQHKPNRFESKTCANVLDALRMNNVSHTPYFAYGSVVDCLLKSLHAGRFRKIRIHKNITGLGKYVLNQQYTRTIIVSLPAEVRMLK